MTKPVEEFQAFDLDAAKSAFVRDGVVVIRGFASADECAALKAQARKIIEGFDFGAHRTVFSTTTQSHAADDYFLSSGGEIRCFLEEGVVNEEGGLLVSKDAAVNKIGHALHDLDPVFSAFSRSQKMRAVAESVGGFQDPLLLQSMVIVKAPKTGGEVTCHQDSTFLYTEPESCVGFWLALDEATNENGCLEFIAGDPEAPLRRIFRRAGAGTEMEVLTEEPYPEEQRVAVPAKIGDLVIFSGRTPHMSRANRSSLPRMAYTLHLIERTAHYPEWNWLQRPREMPLRSFER
ncbi:MAG: phytanoyl-CoA dioxygenase family protein [Parvularculaceae bacterium]